MSEWPVTSGRFNRGRGPILIQEQSKTAAERCTLARNFAMDFDMPKEVLDDKSNAVELLVDNPELGDPFEKEYAPWPLRLFLIKSDGTIDWIAQPKDCSYDEAVADLMLKLELTTREEDTHDNS